MNSFKIEKLKKTLLPMDLQWQLNSCYESRGKEALWYDQRKEVLLNLKDLAIVQSVESSNRIEGVETERERLRPLLNGDFGPRDRPEEELIGYRNALKFIHQNYKEIKINSELIKKLHSLAQDGMIGDAGKWKTSDNEIIEIDDKGDRSIRFSPVKASETEHFVEQLCLSYSELINENSVPELITISFFIFDFLCIHPFRDGNGRVSRLLTLLLLYKSGFTVGAYLSLEKIIEDNKDKYYSVLKESSRLWHSSDHDLLPWLRFFLETLRESYREMEVRVESLSGLTNNKDLLKAFILKQAGYFSLKSIHINFPNVSEALIKKLFASMKGEGLILLEGKGRGAKWKVIVD